MSRDMTQIQFDKALMTQNNTQDIHSLCTEQADAFAAAGDLLPESFRDNYKRILTACYVAHALNLNPAAVMFGRHLNSSPAPAQKAEKPQKPQKAEPATETWPKKRGNDWIDSDGAIYDKSEHGWNKLAKMPSVKADGTFRHARRAVAVKKEATTTEQEQPAPVYDDEALVAANQVLASFKAHVADATTKERLDQIGAQIELMGFTPSELTIARRWIAERAERLEAQK